MRIHMIRRRWFRFDKVFYLIGCCFLLIQIYLTTRSVNSLHDVKPSSRSTTESVGIFRKYLDTKNTTVLKISQLPFQPLCAIAAKEAISAINRAKSRQCKKLIADTYCKNHFGILYPNRLVNSCPNSLNTELKSLGCYRDDRKRRLLNDHILIKLDNAPYSCIRSCLQMGFSYAAVEYGSECFCGNKSPPLSAKLPDSSCNVKCPGDPKMLCGDYYTANVFPTGFTSMATFNATMGLKFDVKIPLARIAYILTVNGRALRQVKRLIKILFHKDHFYYIHVDVREDYLFRELLALEKQYDNIRLARNRFATIWGGASLLQMLLSCMRDLVSDDLFQSGQPRWDYVVNLSESDFPIKRPDSLREFFTLNANFNFVKSHGRDVARFIQKQGLDKIFVECEHRMWRVSDRLLPQGIVMDGGSDWIALSRSFVEHLVLQTDDSLVSGLLAFFRYTLLPAESFFHSVLRNSRFCSTLVDNNLHLTNWRRKLGCKCQYKHVVDWCGCSPNDLRPSDWARIQATANKPLFFARKFEPIINQAVIAKVEAWLFEGVVAMTNLNRYWHNLYHHLDLSPVADDGLLTLARSIMRITVKTYNNNTEIEEVTSFHENDHYQYTLVHDGDVEVAFRPRRMQSDRPFVSSDYDQKEQISRNFVRILHPYSDPVLVWHNNLRKNFTCKWINSMDVIVDNSELFVSSSDFGTNDSVASVGFSKPTNLKKPLLPGAWTVRIYFVDTGTLGNLVRYYGSVRFLVIPLERYHMRKIADAFSMHNSGISDDFTAEDVALADDEWRAELKNVAGKQMMITPNPKEIKSLLLKAKRNGRKQGLELRKWIDTLVNEFYVVEKICLVSTNSSRNNSATWPLCSQTSWSSLAPDMKSDLTPRLLNLGGTFDLRKELTI